MYKIVILIYFFEGKNLYINFQQMKELESRKLDRRKKMHRAIGKSII